MTVHRNYHNINLYVLQIKKKKQANHNELENIFKTACELK